MTFLLPFQKRPYFRGVEIHHLRLLSGDVVALCDADFELVGTLEPDLFAVWLSGIQERVGFARQRLVGSGAQISASAPQQGTGARGCT